MGGTYETPVVCGLLDENFVENLQMQGTFNDESFNRQYRSIWSGDVENAFFSAEKFDKLFKTTGCACDFPILDENNVEDKALSRRVVFVFFMK